MRDRIVWKLKKNGEFTFKSFYSYLVGSLGEGVARFPISQIWKVQALQIIAYFAWEAKKKYILTIDKLMRRCRIMVNGCYICKRAAPTCNHILLCYPGGNSRLKGCVERKYL